MKKILKKLLAPLIREVVKEEVKSLHIDNLIGQFVVLNIPKDAKNHSGADLLCLSELVKQEVVSVLLASLKEICSYTETSHKDCPCNKPQKESH